MRLVQASKSFFGFLQCPIPLLTPARHLTSSVILLRRRPTSKTLRSLHATLQKLEQTDNSAETPQSISELKRVVLNRIADLELTQVLETADIETDEALDADDLIPPPSTPEEELLDEFVENNNLDKLD
jgi:hypothetical protein